jgi:hypothetical protein
MESKDINAVEEKEEEEVGQEAISIDEVSKKSENLKS